MSRHRIPGPKLPLFTYHVTALWTDGVARTIEHRLGRDHAFDEAAEAIQKYDCRVEVMMIERDDYGRPFAVKDVTDNMLTERGLDDDEPEETPLEAARSRAEDDYDSRVSDEIMGEETL